MAGLICFFNQLSPFQGISGCFRQPVVNPLMFPRQPGGVFSVIHPPYLWKKLSGTVSLYFYLGLFDSGSATLITLYSLRFKRNSLLLFFLLV